MSRLEYKEYMTIGELARKVGVTVRTLQYYDKENLIHPSGKTEGGQRLYTHEDEVLLYKILNFKFMGMSLDEIRKALNEYNTAAEVKKLLTEKLVCFENEITQIINKITTLKNLNHSIKDNSKVDWRVYANTIERFQDEGKYFWKLNCIFEENVEEKKNEETEEPEREVPKFTEKTFSEWHTLIIDVIKMLGQGISPESEEAKEIARRYMNIENRPDINEQTANHHRFVIYDGMKDDKMEGSFTQYRYEVNDFLQRAVRNMKNNEEKKQ